MKKQGVQRYLDEANELKQKFEGKNITRRDRLPSRTPDP